MEENIIIINTVDKTIEIVGEVYLGDFMSYVDEFFDENEELDIDEFVFNEKMDQIGLN